MKKQERDKPAPNFDSMLQKDVPQQRNGKHREIVSQILSDIESLADGRALKIPLHELADTKENIRSALNRATRQRGLNVSTASDEEFLYVWMAKNELR